ncbi:polysaccharide lyase family 8 super-sandwich domain-containing protein [Prosthecobacter sp.]|uniref:polysaccharide lyase family 8 super-sandwich domain-containing protein n=1 Tax=Prosthecobacter sp. TaxID=1965333 RepID=UPI0037841601
MMFKLSSFCSFCAGLLLSFSHARGDSSEDAGVVRERYLQWVLGGGAESYRHPLAVHKLKQAVSSAGRVMRELKSIPLDESNPALYNTAKAGADDKEMRFLVTTALPVLSVAFCLPGTDQCQNPCFQKSEVKELIMRVFDRLDKRGFRHPMQMPWKPGQIKKPDPKQAMIVDFILRTSGYPLATLLMRDELAATGRLERALATCWDIESHDEKTGCMTADYLQADGMRVVLNLSLPAALAEGNVERLRLLKKQLDRSLMMESNALDTIKPDGLGHHHRGVYFGGYAAYTMAQAAFAAWLLQGTEFECEAETVSHLCKGMETLRVVSQKYDMHRALSGRLGGTQVIPDVMLGYAYLADLQQPRRKECQGMFARLADEAFMSSPLPRNALAGHRDEVSPGPGAVLHFMKTLEDARKVGAEADPSGNWALNYGPLMIHRRDDWMVSIKGYSRYWWAFERSLVDARKDARLENVFGFHDSSGSLFIYGRGEPWVNAKDSGYAKGGWDWCRVPGTTTRYFTPAEWKEIDKNEEYNRPFSDRSFAGGQSLEGRWGMFVLDYMEAAPDERKTPLRALKTAFFFDDQIVMLGSGIRDGDGSHGVSTTLFQTHLPDDQIPTFIQREALTEVTDQEFSFEEGPLELVDAAGNGYFIPAGQQTVLTRRIQKSMNDTGTRETKGAFTSAWLDHGTSPDNAGYEYVILVRSEMKGLASFAARAGDEYKVLRKDEVAHIVRHHRLGVTGYAVAKADTDTADSLVKCASSPCLIMTRELPDGGRSMSVCNPDLGWEKGKQYALKGKEEVGEPMGPVSMPVTLTLNGLWNLKQPMDRAECVVSEGVTTITLPCQDAQGIGFELVKVNP